MNEIVFRYFVIMFELITISIACYNLVLFSFFLESKKIIYSETLFQSYISNLIRV